ncbi:ABC transporter permease [Raineyella fluvialis]|uniref:Autoinducer 2 import system permease protein LsrD n=1 Tax=Raineyella fluvialis TaxID=2662261 RepID=A0A5Q2FAY2_9ACTN|nr:ABC transporter permease [Raineyella fluvialis]QGF22877.1 ABC transporter permease [Raineyella fluvialis]
MRSILKSYSWELLLVVLIGAAFVWSSMLSPYFLDPINLANSAAFFVIFAFMALGQFPIVVQGEIDLSLPSILAVSSVTYATLAVRGVPLPAAVGAILAVTVAMGVLNGVLVARFGLPSLAVTLGTAGAFRGIAYIIAGAAGVTGLPKQYTILGRMWVWILPVWVVLTVVAAVAFAVLMGATRFGRECYAIGNNRAATRMAAVRVVRAQIGAYGLAGAMAGVAGIVWVSQYQSARGDNADGAILFVLTAVVLGGVSIKGGSGRALGVGLSLTLLGTLQTGMQLANVPGTSQTLVIGALLVIAVAVPTLLQLITSWRRKLVGSTHADQLHHDGPPSLRSAGESPLKGR